MKGRRETFVRIFTRLAVWVVVTGALAAGTASAVKPPETRETLAKGKAIFERSCVWCHGTGGKGDGPAAFFIASYSAPRPRDFTAGEYKFRSTPSGELPTDEDLFRTITNGVPGYMPPFAGLEEKERRQAIAYIKTFFSGFREETPTSIPIGFPAVPSSPESVEKGRKLYVLNECHTCHGENGAGDETAARAGELKDSLGLPIAPTDLTNPASLKNGATARDLFRSVMTGFNGTPMPSYAAQFAGREEEAWHLVNYLLSLSQ
ncbi:MAG: c-type cytochrome [Nitrospirae bacterium]|nr:c-type cytochrome [Nitrospirota bacterium]